MFKYKGISCPHCGEEFKEDDQILICPDCGAPYHRHCVEELGKCMFDDLHARHESWQPPQKAPHEEEAEQKYDGRAAMRCGRCGTLAPPHSLFCPVCGTPLNGEAAEGQEPPFPGGETASPGGQPFRQMAYNPYTTPFGGLSPDEEVEDIPAKDLVLYVGQNTHYFLPKFKEMAARGKSVSWNWSAFFLGAYYFFYRKMWGLGAIATVLSLFLSAPSLIITFNAVFYQLGMEMPASAAALQFLDNVSNYFYILSLALNLFFGLFFNRLYKNKVFRNIRSIREENAGGQDQDYGIQLAKKGGVSVKAIFIFIAINMAVSFTMTFIMVGAVMRMY